MTHPLTALIAGLVIAAAVPAAAQSPYPAPDGVEILVEGAPRPRYAHAGRFYVEAQKGREYAIRLRNPFGVRVAVALSVDGLNTIDARHTSATEARKWVLGPYETVIISGWQTSRTEARRFEFTNEEQSYGAALGKTNDLGLISAVFFRERVAEVQSRREADSSAPRPQQLPAAPQPSAAAEGKSTARANDSASDELAATGMGRRTEHAVTQVYLDLENTPARTVNVRYEFRPQLVKLGVLPPAHAATPLERRERAEGFERGFSPVVD